MRPTSLAALPLALAVAAATSCSKESPTGPTTLGNVTCGSADQSVCPRAGLTLGFNGTTATPTIALANASTTVTATSSAYEVTGTTSATLPGYWLVVVGGNLRAWGQMGVLTGAFIADIPLFCGQQAVLFRFDNGSGTSYWYSNVTLRNCTTPLFRAQLTWDTNEDDTLNSDMDLHLIRPGGTMNGDSDCFFADCKVIEVPAGLEWGATGPAGNPSLDVDNVIGFGPENITIQSAPDPGAFPVIVYNYSGFAGTHPTVKIFFNDVEVARYTSAQPVDWPNNAYWYVATVDIANQVITAKNTYSGTPPVAPLARSIAMPRKLAAPFRR